MINEKHFVQTNKPTKEEPKKISRRDFLRKSAKGMAALTLASYGVLPNKSHAENRESDISIKRKIKIRRSDIFIYETSDNIIVDSEKRPVEDMGGFFKLPDSSTFIKNYDNDWELCTKDGKTIMEIYEEIEGDLGVNLGYNITVEENGLEIDLFERNFDLEIENGNFVATSHGDDDDEKLDIENFKTLIRSRMQEMRHFLERHKGSIQQLDSIDIENEFSNFADTLNQFSQNINSQTQENPSKKGVITSIHKAVIGKHWRKKVMDIISANEQEYDYEGFYNVPVMWHRFASKRGYVCNRQEIFEKPSSEALFSKITESGMHQIKDNRVLAELFNELPIDNLEIPYFYFNEKQTRIGGTQIDDSVIVNTALGTPKEVIMNNELAHILIDKYFPSIKGITLGGNRFLDFEGEVPVNSGREVNEFLSDVASINTEVPEKPQQAREEIKRILYFSFYPQGVPHTYRFTIEFMLNQVVSALAKQKENNLTSPDSAINALTDEDIKNIQASYMATGKKLIAYMKNKGMFQEVKI